MGVKKNVQNLLLVSGTGRNSGKTTFACEVIKNLSRERSVYTLKISPHFHRLSEKQELISESINYKIYREYDRNLSKDSSRMLAAGATASYFIQCDDRHLTETVQLVLTFIPEGCPIVCESGSVSTYFKPGLHLLIENKNREESKKSCIENGQLADRVIRFDGTNFNLIIDQVSFDGKTWNLD